MDDCKTVNIYRYWGKAQPLEDGRAPYHLLPYHCLDVAAAGKTLLERRPALLRLFGDLSGIDTKSFLDWSTFLLAIHDVGKFADGFQNKAPDLLRQLQGRATQASSNEHHGKIGYLFYLKYVANGNIFENDLLDLLEPWLCAVMGHHGRPPVLDISMQPIKTQFPGQVREDALAFVKETIAMFLPDGLPFQSGVSDTKFRRVSWLMAGLAVVADWIGSNQPWFHYCAKPMPLNDYWRNVALPKAATAVAKSGLTAVDIAPSIGMRALFPNIHTPTPLQLLAEEVKIAEGAQLFIIEEVTGGGKTEAAITLTHRLMSSGLADGLFMALPTMATANAMHKRVRAIYRKLFSKDANPSLVLVCTESQMVLDLERENVADEGYGQGDTSASQECAAWLADSNKKALLADVGVGTIDQALLAILAVRHQSLRLLGLVRKVLIVDEVHACDAYMHRLLRTLLKFHSAQGGSAILLSATLPQVMRAELIKSFADGVGEKVEGLKENHYPLLTHFSAQGERELPAAERRSTSKYVKAQPCHSVDEVNAMLQEALDAGDCACWVHNTVYDALQSYDEWVSRLGEDRVMLFHARFALGDRLGIEKEVIRCFDLNSEEKDRRGRLLIATQVAEQSLDLDFDFMVSDLAPIDLLIQRAGRLHRHNRGPRKPPVLGVYMPKPLKDAGEDWFKTMFPKAAWVYRHHGQLWLTARWICERKGFCISDDAREMIECVYKDESQTEIPEALQKVENRAEGEDEGEGGLGWLNSLKLDDGYQATMCHWQDDVSAPTRLGEPTVTVRLARFDGRCLVPWIAQNTGHNWELSQLSIRRSQIAQEDPDNMPEDVKGVKRTMPDRGRYCVVIPMHKSGEMWTGQALNVRDETVDMTYSCHRGLEINKRGDE